MNIKEGKHYMINGFSVEVNGRLYGSTFGFRKLDVVETDSNNNGTITLQTCYLCDDGLFTVIVKTKSYPDSPVMERWVEIVNISEQSLTVSRIDSFSDIIPEGSYTLDYFVCYGNGYEYSPQSVPLEGTKVLESTSGRSSLGPHPWFTLKEAGGSILACAFAWSGNWIARFEPAADGTYKLSGGLSNWCFHKSLQPGEMLEGIHIMTVCFPYGSLDDVSAAFGYWGRTFWYPSQAWSESIPVAWNHWWPYEDLDIHEDVFKSNVDEAARLGIEVCTLDAGWFGESDPVLQANTEDWNDHFDWYSKRGDWHKVNAIRFPSGIAALSDYVHAKGMKFGIWCEIEALGVKAESAKTHPELVARRDGKHLGYVCLGNPESVTWAFGVLERLITEYKADWLKIDFNLDPKAGCSRVDHGHGAGDGLFEHYQGLYRLLDMVREEYPHVYLENCSSGGMRIDLGMAKHTHCTFLSDPDYTHHHLQVFWGASLMLHPSALFHFSASQHRAYYDNHYEKDPIKPDLPLHQFDYMIRANMLNGFGCSYRLPELPDWCKERLAHHICFYKEKVRDFIRQGEMRQLTGQTLRDGQGDLWNAYLYVKKGGAEALLFVFRMKGGEANRTIRLSGIDREAMFTLHFVDNDQVLTRSGESLLEEGFTFSCKEESSEVVTIRQITKLCK
jgi:alpha-galactosidase